MRQADSDLRKRLQVARLPVLPQILLQLIQQCQTDEIVVPALAELIAKDPAMTCKILGLAHGSASRRASRRAGLEQSLTALGTDTIKSLVISESVFQVFNEASYANSVDLRRFWQHSLETALLARSIAEWMRYPHLEEAYLAGLLHDIGRLAFFTASPAEYNRSFLDQDDEILCAFEQRTFHVSHPEVGSWLIENWDLDSFMADSVLYHHESMARLESAHPLVRIVRLAHRLSCRKTGDPGISESGDVYGIKAAALEQMSDQAISQVETFAELLGIDLAVAQKSLTVPAEVEVQDEVKHQLSDEVRNLMLASEAGRSFARLQGEAGLLESVTRSARMLFNFEDVLVLLMNGAGKALLGIPVGEHKQRLSEFSIALGSSGLIAEAAVQRRLAFAGTDGNPLGIAEEQLLRMLGCESLVCVPLISGQRCLGVMIGGSAPWQTAGLLRRERFLKAFGEQAAVALESALGERGEASRRVASIAEEYRETSRRVAHEVNNPLSIIKNYLSILGGKLEKHEPVVSELSILNEELDRVGHIIKGLADLKPTSRDTGAEVNRVVRDIVRLFRDTEFVPASVKIVAETQDLPTEVEGSADKLKQILVNLVKNAIEALPSGGEIHIANNGHVNRDGLLYIEVSVRDSGPGIPPEILENLFSPVQSTKGTGHQGLGLSIVHNLVKKVQGLITCRSSSKGTAFEILLPIRKRNYQVVPGGN